MLYYRCALLRLMHIIQTTIFPSDVYIMYNVHTYILLIYSFS